MSKRVLLAAPRGYCAGVDRAVVTVEKALELYGAPVYVRKEIVHNKHVVSTLEARGAIFVSENDEVPEGQTVIFSAHGVSPAVHASAASRNLKTIDATCPLVTKVHHEVKRFAAEDLTILLIGHQGHEEVEGTAGEAPDNVILVDGTDGLNDLKVVDENKVAWLSQTTLSVDETLTTVAALKVFGPVYVMTNGGPGDATQVPAFFSYFHFFSTLRVGYGAAIATVLALILTVLAISLLRLQRKVELSR